MFEKKNSKKRGSREKKKKRRKKDECVFLLLVFFISAGKKKIVSFTQHTDIKYHIPLVFHFLSHERKHTHTYIFLLVSYK